MTSQLWLAVIIKFTKGYRPESESIVREFVNWDDAPDGLLQAAQIVLDRWQAMRDQDWMVDEITVRKS